MITGKRVRFSI